MTKPINKKKGLPIFWMAFLVASLAMMTGWAFGGNGKGPEKQVIIKSEKGDVSFSHSEHMSVEGGCGICHSKYPPKSGKIEEMKSKGNLKPRDVMNMCRDCHGKLMAADKETGPTADCLGCHKK